MDESQKDRAQELVDQLKDTGTNCGVMGVQGIVVMRCPGSPYLDTPMNFDEADLENAIALGLVRKQKMVGSYEWEYYVVAA
jgi:hypothetical protein